MKWGGVRVHVCGYTVPVVQRFDARAERGSASVQTSVSRTEVEDVFGVIWRALAWEAICDVCSVFLAFQRGGGEEEGQEGEEQNRCGKVSQQTEGADRHSAGCK